MPHVQLHGASIACSETWQTQLLTLLCCSQNPLSSAQTHDLAMLQAPCSHLAADEGWQLTPVCSPKAPVITYLCCRYVNTTAVKSCISFIDGDKGILRYRGYPIEQLAEHSSFLEVGCAPRQPLYALACWAVLHW